MPKFNLAQATELFAIFDFDVVINGDGMIGEIWLGDNFLYFVELI